MSGNNRIPRKDADFSNYVNIAIPYLTTNKTRLVITTAAQNNLTQAVSLLSTAVTGWNSVYQLSQNASTATSTIVANKDSIRSQVEKLLREIYADIPRSVLNQTDRDTLKIQLPSDSRKPASIPTAVPTITVSTRGHLSLTLNIIDSAHPTTIAKPEGVDAIELEGAFLSAIIAIPATFPLESDFRHITTTGRTSILRTYLADQIKGMEYFRARYLNSRKEAGNWSNWISEIVS